MYPNALPSLVYKNIIRDYIKLPVCTRYLKRLPQTEIEKDLKPMRLPGALGEMTGTTLYPDEASAKWDVDGKIFFVYTCM